MEIITITLNLTPKEIKLLRNCISDLGVNDKDCISLQLKIADAIIEAS